MSPTSPRSFEDLARDLERLQEVVESWTDDQAKGTVHAIRSTLEALHREALTGLIRGARAEEGGLALLKRVMGSEPSVAAILQYHELIKAPQDTLRTRIEAALESVRPMLASHEGNVELVSVEPPEVKIQLIGSCDGCAHSDVTVRYGIEEAIKAAAPEITKLTVVAPEQAARLVGLRGLDGSPFEKGWEEAGPTEEVPAGDVLARELERASVLLTRVGDEIRAFPNACTHLGMPLDGGVVENGILTCPYHDFRYSIATGECLTAPEAQLPRLPCRVEGDRVLVQTGGGR